MQGVTVTGYIHYGNFIVSPDETSITIVDFGLLKRLAPNHHAALHPLYMTVMQGNFPQFVEVATLLGFKTSEWYTLFQYFRLQFEPWRTPEFTFTTEWLSRATKMPWKMVLDVNIPPHLIYFNKFTYGLLGILTRLECSGNFKQYIRV